MSAFIGEIFFLLFLILLNGVLVMTEIAVVSARKARLQQRADEGDPRARAALELANAPRQFLSTIQIGVTLIGIVAGAFGGATIAEELGTFLSRIPLLAPYSDALGFGIVVLSVTVLMLLMGQLVPKQLAWHNAEWLVTAVAPPLQRFSRLTLPAVRLLSALTEKILWMLGVRPLADLPITQEELRVFLKQSTQGEAFEETERRMVESVLRLSDQRVGTLMTPRREIFWLDLQDSPEELRQKVIKSAYTRFPVGQDSLDNPLGIVEAKDLLACNLDEQRRDLKAVLQSPLFVPESMPASKALEGFKRSRMEMALVVDEYGVTQGLITLTDLVAAIVGELPSVVEPTEAPVVQREDGSWLLDAMLPVEKLKEVFHIEYLPEEERGYYQTLGGFMMMYLKQIPTVSQHFEWGGFRFEVVDMDLHRVDKVLVVPVGQKQKGEK